MKVTREMVEYWLGSEPSIKDIITDIKDMANGKYDMDILKQDIIETWKNKY